MARFLYEVELRPEIDGGYSVRVPDLDGCYSQGNTLNEALEMAADALVTHVAALLKFGDTIPTPVFGHQVPDGGKVVAISFDTDASYIINDQNAVSTAIPSPLRSRSFFSQV